MWEIADVKKKKKKKNLLDRLGAQPHRDGRGMASLHASRWRNPAGEKIYTWLRTSQVLNSTAPGLL